MRSVVTLGVLTLRRRAFAPELYLCLAMCLLEETPAAADSGNDRYSFAPGGSRQRGITMERTETGATLPLNAAALSAADTLLLGLRVAAHGDQPRIRASLGALSVEQHLDAGAHGLRWLNLTSLRPAAGKATKLTLEALDLTLTGHEANLRLFQNRIPFERGVLILAPHPDDAEIAAFGLYASHAAEARIVTITAGNAGAPTYQPQFAGEIPAHYQFKGVLRVIDSVTVPWQGGVPPERCFNLGYFDDRLAAMYAQKSAAVPEVFSDNRDVMPYRRANLGELLPAVSRLNSWQNLVADLAQLLAEIDPGVVVMPHPLLDAHPDHQYAAVAALEALAQHPRPVTFLLYTNHAGDNLYPYGPAGGVMSLPPWTSDDLPVQGVYALPIDRALQRRKLFALESMHDLRLSPDEQRHCGARPPDADSPRHEDTDYFRRAPRSEELFFVFDRGGLNALVQRFLAGAGGADARPIGRPQ